ncbi:serine hydrolase domain-containing protein [Pseudolysinimonas sp.]|uniref:serine hydrolase domain-containing protein n=1 Tax=Pseudolysinimonas sp. TaxID=2680009 RepID=UPI003F7D59FE
MSAAEAVAALLALGEEGARPASASVAIWAGDDLDLAAGGWAVPAEIGDGIPMTSALLLDCASVTKAFATTTIAMLLVARGELRLETRVREILPAFVPAGSDAITVEHLLTHTAGLAPWQPLYCVTRDRDEALALVQRLPLQERPGTVFRYSDLGFMLAGLVLERIASARLDELFRTMIAEPLGIRARFGPVPADLAAAGADSDAWEHRMVATGDPYPVAARPGDFAGWRRGLVRGTAGDVNAAHALGGVSGHAGLFATAGDLARIARALSAGELVPAEIVELFARPSAVEPSQGVGFRLRELPGASPRRLLWHPGFTGTYAAFSPDGPFAIAGGAMRLVGTIGPLTDDDRLRREPVPGPRVTELMHELAGRHAGRHADPSRETR